MVQLNHAPLHHHSIHQLDLILRAIHLQEFCEGERTGADPLDGLFVDFLLYDHVALPSMRWVVVL